MQQLEPPGRLPIPSGAEIRLARRYAGMNIRSFARKIGAGSFSTWARYEQGGAIRVGTIPEEAWQRVRYFIAQHRPKTGEE